MDGVVAVSIVIPVYNGADYLAEAVASALAQTCDSFEVLVVDDGSTDEGKTESVARGFGDRIRYFRKPNGGVATALNFGIEHALGTYISWLSHDDAYMPDKLVSQLAFVGTLPDPETVVYADVEMIDDASRTLGIRRLPDLHAERILEELLVASPVNGCTTLIKKTCFDAVGLFDPALRTTQDLDMWLRLASRFPFRRLPEVVLRSRQHPGQGTRALGGIHARNVDDFLVSSLDRYAPEQLFGPERDGWSVGYLRLALAFARDDRPLATRRALELAREAPGSSILAERLKVRAILARNRLKTAAVGFLGLDHLDSGFKRRLYRWYRAVRDARA